MDRAESHVSLTALQLFLAAKLSPADHQAVEKHLQSCHSCAQRLSSWELCLLQLQDELTSSGPPCSSAIDMAQHDLIDSICDRFERAWRSGDDPQIDDFLAHVGEIDLPALRNELTLLKEDLEQARTRLDLRAADRSAAVEQIEPATRPQRMGQLGNYVLREEIAKGRLGSVYRARRLCDGKEVAVKLMVAVARVVESMQMQWQERVEAAKQLRHPNLVAMYEMGLTGQRCYWVTQLVRGTCLSQQVDQIRCPTRRAATIIQQAAEAIGHAHERGMVHGHLKPTKILLDQQDRVLVSGFGVAYQSPDSSELTISGNVFETPLYMAPEQAGGSSASPHPTIDVYALGAVLYLLLTGRPPFPGKHLLDTLRRILKEPVTPPSRWRSTLSSDLESICLRCLEKNPERRYSSALALAQALGNYLEQGDTASGGQGAWKRWGTWWRAHWGRDARR